MKRRENKNIVNQSISIIVSYFLVSTPLYANDLEIDGSTKTNIDKSRNGISIVNIANPNSNGLSHNKFKNYNVNKKGLILNNSKNTSVNTKLAGYIYGNTNLKTNAKVILNEVTSTRRTKLNGYTEIAGKKADLIIANPNGININGAGFINTNNVTITTAKPNIVSGNIKNFSIKGGDISIDGDGLDTSNQSSTNIYTAYLKLNAKIHAQDLNIKLGENEIDYKSKKILSSNKLNKKLLLDSSALGGMYANRISLVGTSKGVGVKLPPEVLASTGDISITNDGKISLQKLTAKTNINVISKNDNINIANNTYSENETTLKAKTIINEAIISSKKDITLDSNSLVNNKTILAGLNSDKTLNENGKVNITNDTITNSGEIQSSNAISLNTNKLINKENSKLVATNDLSVKVINSIINDGNIYSNNTLSLNTKDLTNNNTILAKNTTLNTTNIINTKDLLASNDLIINNSNTITNSNSNIKANNKLTLTTDILDNTQGNIKSEKDLSITSSNINNEKGNIKALNDSTITTNTIDLINSTIFAKNQTLKLNSLDNISSSSIGANNNLNIQTTIGDIINNAELLANGTLSLNSKGALKNYSTISGKSLNLTANSLINDSTISGGTNSSIISIINDITNNSRISAQGDLKVKATNITNNGYFNSGNDLTLTSTNNLTNNKTLFATNDMYLYTTNALSNMQNANIFAMNNLTLAKNSSGEKTSRISNKSANIETYNGDINIYANTFENRRTQNLEDLYTHNHIDETLYFENGSSEGSLLKLISTGWSNGWFDADVKGYPFALGFDIDGPVKGTFRGVVDEVLPKSGISGASTLHSGKDINFYTGNIKNHTSNIYAKDYINFNGGSLENKQIEFGGSIDFLINANTSLAIYRNGNRIVHQGRYPHYSYDLGINASPISSIIQAGKGLRGAISSFNNGTMRVSSVGKTSSKSEDTSSTSQDNSLNSNNILNENLIQVPTDDYGLFVKSKNSNSKYLIETNPEFTMYSNFISSDYMMDKLNISPSITSKRLGDSFYENKLIRESIQKQTGKTYLNKDLTNDYDQYKYLMDNAISVQKDLKLTAGVSLTKEQINALTKDIVWMEEKVVDGQKVLVPVVYIANVDDTKVEGASIIAGGSIDLKVDNLANSGTIQSGGDITVDAKDTITNTNGTIKAEEDMSLTAQNDIKNLSGKIAAKNIDLTSDSGSVINERYQENIDLKYDSLKTSFTKTGGSSSIQATNDVNLNAKQNISIKGSEVKASKLNLNADTISIGATQDGYKNNSSDYKTTNFLSNVEAENINLNSKNDTNIKGANILATEDMKIKAKNFNLEAVKDDISFDTIFHTLNKAEYKRSSIDAKNLTVSADGDVNIKGSNISAKDSLNIESSAISIESVQDSSYEKKVSMSKHTFSKSTTTTTTASSKNIASNLSGGNINIKTTKDDITIKGSNVKADDSLSLNSAGDINIQAGYDGSLSESHTKKSKFSLGGLLTGGNLYTMTDDLEGKMKKTAVSSNLSGKNITMNANNDISMEGTNLQASKSISAKAQDITIKNATNEEKTYSKHTKINISMLDIGKALTRPDQIVKTKDGKATVSLAKASYESADKVTTKTTVTSSNLSANNISLNSSSSDTSKGNIQVEGSNLKADDTLELTASNNITVKEAKETEKTTSKEKKGEGELSLTVKNEYEQTARALEAIKKAKDNLSKAKNDYNQYKKDLATQNTKLAELKEKLKNKTGFIEQADVDELQSYINDMKSDEAFYKTNIALAAATVATKTTAAITQGAKAARSSTTAGFNVGLELDIDTIETMLNNYKTKSVASNLSANNIKISSKNTTTIQGSNLQGDNINIDAKDTKILASQDIDTTTSSTEHKNINISADIYGGSGLGNSFGMSGGAGSVSSDSSKSYSNSLTNINSNIQANNININTKDTTTVNGATLKANDSLNIDTKNLDVASVQNSNKSNSKSSGVSAGFGTNGLSSVGANSSKSYSRSTKTVLTSLTGEKVNINVQKDTTLKGATIAALDKDGKDNGNLNLSTDTLRVSSLNNINQSKSTSANVNLGGSNVSIGYENSRSNSKTKTLATLGNGNVQVGDKTNSDTRMLNRDVANNEVDIYNISSTAKLNGELDTRLLTKNGRNEIKDELTTSKTILDAIEQIATTEKAGLKDFFTEVKKNVDVYEGMKKEIAKNPDLAKQLSDPNLTPKEKQEMLQTVANTVKESLGYKVKKDDVKLVSTDKKGAEGKEFKGHYNDKKTYINDKNNKDTKDLLTTIGHETQHNMDDQRDNFKAQDKDQNTYATNFGEDLASYTSAALDIVANKNLASTNTHNNGQVTSSPSIFNDNTLVNNNKQFAKVDTSNGDDLTREEAYQAVAQAKKYGVNLVVAEDVTSEGGYVATTPDQATKLAQNMAGLTNEEKQQLTNDRLKNIGKNTFELVSYLTLFYTTGELISAGKPILKSTIKSKENEFINMFEKSKSGVNESQLSKVINEPKTPTKLINDLKKPTPTTESVGVSRPIDGTLNKEIQLKQYARENKISNSGTTGDKANKVINNITENVMKGLGGN